MEATTAMAGLDTPASRDAMGALADALEDATKEVKRLEVGPQGPLDPSMCLTGRQDIARVRSAFLLAADALCITWWLSQRTRC